MSSQGVISSEQAHNNPGLCPIIGQESGPRNQVRPINQFSSLSLCTARTTPQYQMLACHPEFYFSSYILPSDPQEMLRSNKTLNRTIPCRPVGIFISSHSGMPRDPTQPHSVQVDINFSVITQNSHSICSDTTN